jgi:hypothetical protein
MIREKGGRVTNEWKLCPPQSRFVLAATTVSARRNENVEGGD